MDELTEEPAALTERVAALDIGKASLTACIRVPHEDRPGARRQEVRTYATLTPALLELRDWLVCQGVTLVVMEATGVIRGFKINNDVSAGRALAYASAMEGQERQRRGVVAR